MARVKLTKNELKVQKDALKRYQRYLPTLSLKKQQLQRVIRTVEEEIQTIRTRIDERVEELTAWIAVFGEDQQLENRVKVLELITGEGNIAGVDIPVFEDLTFENKREDFFNTPPWVARAIATLEDLLREEAEIGVLYEQAARLRDELETTSQRVNLFEKIKIPEAKENIRKIAISLGDQETAAVVRGKISKNRLVGERA